MRKLFYIPIVHNAADLGSLGAQLSAEGESKYGAARWQNHLEEVNNAWDMIEIEINTQLKDIPFANIKIYQDGLPVVGEIGLKIVQDAAAAGSKNYQIVETFLTKGASLIQAEDKALLLKEYSLLSAINKAEDPEKQVEAYMAYQLVSQELLNDRDRYISDQINLTLQDGETGIAFFGAAHSIIPLLNNNIDVIVIKMFKDIISQNLSKPK
jgi:hypothetical protein